MYYLKKRLEISACHQLHLDYESKCNNLHGHNWIVYIYCKSKQLNKNGMVMDFTEIKNRVMNKIDHHFINDVVNFNPTAENLAKWIHDQIDNCYKVEVQETEGNSAVYED